MALVSGLKVCLGDASAYHLRVVSGRVLRLLSVTLYRAVFRILLHISVWFVNDN
jgi:hypothetical protein